MAVLAVFLCRNIQQGQILQFGHKVLHIDSREDIGELTDTVPPNNSPSTRNPPPAGIPGQEKQCIATKSGGQLIPATDRQSLEDALNGALASADTVGSSNIAAPLLPSLSARAGDTALVGAVIASRKNPDPPTGDGANSRWAVWNGALKAYRLDRNGNIPTVGTTGTPGTNPNPTPKVPDESAPEDPAMAIRKPVWNAGRLLGYTDPVSAPAEASAAAAPLEANNAGLITVWGGRRMIWGDGNGPEVPRLRQEFLPNSSSGTRSCTGTAKVGDCFFDLTTAMGLKPSSATDLTRAIQTVQFLRGGKTSTGSRDEILEDLGTATPGTYGTSVLPNTVYSYRYQDDLPPANPPSAHTGTSDPKYYAHKLGDIFHSETVVLLPPKYFQYVSSNLNPRPGETGSCGGPTGCSYVAFRDYHKFRRKVAFVGSNDGFLHAFDAGVYDRDNDPGTPGPTEAHPFNDSFDLGTGREIFAFAPKAVMPVDGDHGFANLLNYPPKPQYLVDGSPVLADVFIDTHHNGNPTGGHRKWKTILVSGLRQGGHSYFALDVTQPDLYASDGTKAASDKDSFPDCVDGGGGQCPDLYPTVLWEMTDNTTSPMGETWSRPVVGRIKLTGKRAGDRYVAILGGGFDSSFVPGTAVAAGDTTIKGRGFYIVDVETGNILYKATTGKAAGSGDSIEFAPMPAPPAVVDIDDDGYLDVVYIGDLNGRMWRVDLRNARCCTANQLTQINPFLLYDATASSTQPVQPVFLEPGIIFVSGGASPAFGVAWGAGYRAERLRANLRLVPDPQNPGKMIAIAYTDRFHYVIDPGGEAITFTEGNLENITPTGGSLPTPAVACTDPNTASNCGFFLDFASPDEKAVSTVFSTFGNLSLVTFVPDRQNPLRGNGNSFRYSFNYRLGTGTYGPDATLSSYQISLGRGLASLAQSQSSTGQLIDTILFSGGEIQQQTIGGLKTLSDNWKEQ